VANVVSNSGKIGDQILQPGPHDGGNLTMDMIARLTEFVPIEFIGDPGDCNIGKAFASLGNVPAKLSGSRFRLSLVKAKAIDNLVDAAIAEPIDPKDVSAEVLEIGEIPSSIITEPEVGMPIKKSGRTTGLTHGEITQINVATQVQYGGNKIAMFSDQLMAGAMSAGGDSGGVDMVVTRAIESGHK